MKKIIILSLLTTTVIAKTMSFTIPSDQIITSYISSCKSEASLFLRSTNGSNSEFKLGNEVNCKRAKNNLTLAGLVDQNTNEIKKAQVIIDMSEMTVTSISQQ